MSKNLRNWHFITFFRGHETENHSSWLTALQLLNAGRLPVRMRAE
jgi:hypothetical protein